MLRFGTKRNTHMRLRDREAFAAVALVWPLAVFIEHYRIGLEECSTDPSPMAHRLQTLHEVQSMHGSIHVWIFNDWSNRHLHIDEPQLLTWYGLYQFAATWTVVLAISYAMVRWNGYHYAWNDCPV